MTDAWIPHDEVSKVYSNLSRANAGEVFPDPMSPLSASVGFIHTIEPGACRQLVGTGLFDESMFDRDVARNAYGVFHGFLYVNISINRLMAVRLGIGAEAIDAAFGEMPGIPSYESEARPGDEDPDATARGGAWMGGAATRTDLGPWNDDRAAAEAVVAGRPDLGSATNGELLVRLTDFDEMMTGLWCNHLEASILAAFGIGGCGQLAAAVGKPELGLAVSSAHGSVDSAMASHEMWPLGRMVASSPHLTSVFDGNPDGRWAALFDDDHSDAVAFRHKVEDFLLTWGFRGPNEWEMRSKTWGTNPELVMTALDLMRQSDESDGPEKRAEAQVAEREAAVAELRALVAGDAETAGMFEGQLHMASLYSRGREKARMTVAMVLHEKRLAADEIGRRLTADGTLERAELVYMLSIDELRAVVEGSDMAPAGAAAARESRYLELFDYIPPFVVSGAVPELETWDRRSNASAGKPLAVGESLQGMGGGPGKASGAVRVVQSPFEADLEPGEILVCPISDPAWTPLFVPAAGVVCEVGSAVSHAAIVSRELGIPCAVSIQNATQRLTDGMTVEIDGATGVVTRTR